MAKEFETRMIVISPSSSVTPDQVTRLVQLLGLEIHRQGDLLRGDDRGRQGGRGKALAAIRKLDPDRIFTKVRGSRSGTRGDAGPITAPGRLHPAGEGMECLRLVDKGVSAAVRNEKVCEAPRPQKAAGQEAQGDNR